MELNDYIEGLGELLRYEKGGVVCSQGDASHHLYLVKQGSLKAYYITHGGKEYVKSFVFENGFIGDLSSYHAPKPDCSFTLVCLEASLLFRFKYADMLDLAKKDTSVFVLIIDMLVSVISKKERREFEFLCLSSEERYKQIQEQTPELLERVTQNDIARYLGITPVALSRIKTKLLRQRKP